MPSTAAYLAIGGVAAVATFLLTPLVGYLARRLGWVVEPDARRVHKVTTPDVGGIAMFGGFAIAFAVARLTHVFGPLFAANSEPYGVFLGAFVMFAVGLVDDVRELSAPAKVFGTVVVAVILVYFGVTMFYLRVPFSPVFVLSDDWVPLVTVVWLLVMTQAINLIDGLDGLAAGIVAISAGAFFVYSHKLDQLHYLTPPNLGPLIAIMTLGICIGFLPHNFNPARIFMGDSGALLLGMLMAVSTSVVGGRADPSNPSLPGQSYFFYAPLVVPILILGVPILDALFAVVRRASRRQGLATADKGHLHHRLMDLGHGQRRSVLILWLWTALLSTVVLYPVLTESDVSYIPIGAAALALGLFTVLHPQLQRRRSNGT
ncbi:MAG: wecA [Ilumatobacteraceae bacterium]|nr:wecA [Ilumatobacteraceae bacterium]